MDDKFELNTAIILQFPEHIRKAIELNLGHRLDGNGVYDSNGAYYGNCIP